MSVKVQMKNPESGEEQNIIFDDRYLMRIIESDLDRVYDELGKLVCKCQPVGETNVIDCGCDDYIFDFVIKSINITS